MKKAQFRTKRADKVLGHTWDAQGDKFEFTLSVNLYHKRRGVKTGPDITRENVEMVDKEMFTKRKALSMLASFYDPMGLFCAHIITLKIMMRELCQYEEPKSANGGGDVEECRLGWDDRLPIGLETKWKKVTKELVMAESVQFPRGTKPANALGRPEVIAFWDGSMQAFATTIYIRWKI